MKKVFKNYDVYLYLNESPYGGRYWCVHRDDLTGRLMWPDRNVKILGPAIVGPGGYLDELDAAEALAEAAGVELGPRKWKPKAVSVAHPSVAGFVAVLSTTVIPVDGTYRVETLPPGTVPQISGVPHYIGHPDTKAIVEGLGAVQAKEKLFPGLQVGEQAVCFPIAQGKSTRATDGFTSPHQGVSLNDLQVRVITRLE